MFSNIVTAYLILGIGTVMATCVFCVEFSITKGGHSGKKLFQRGKRRNHEHVNTKKSPIAPQESQNYYHKGLAIRIATDSSTIKASYPQWKTTMELGATETVDKPLAVRYAFPQTLDRPSAVRSASPLKSQLGRAAFDQHPVIHVKSRPRRSQFANVNTL